MFSQKTARFVLVILICKLCATLHATELHDTSRFRRPVAIGRLNDDLICIANRVSGTISLVNVKTRSVIGERAVGQRISDMTVTRDGRQLLITDDQRHELIVLNHRNGALNVCARIGVSPYPVRVRISPDATKCSVTSVWSRTVTLLDVKSTTDSNGLQLGPVGVVSLPFEPREQIWLPARGRLVVADAFAGQIAVIDATSARCESVREITGHNLHGLALSHDGDHVLASQQVLNPLAPTTRSNIIWSVLMTNCVRQFSVAALVDPKANLMSASRFIPLGTSGRGAGDPAAVTIDSKGRILIALSGVHQVAVLDKSGRNEQRVAVGQRPIAILPLPDNGRFCVLNYFSDSISVVEIADGELRQSSETSHPYTTYGSSDDPRYASTNTPLNARVEEISLGPTTKRTSVEAGEALFFDARLSHDNWYSCHSCHTDGHTNAGLADTLGDGHYGAPKRIPSLLGVGQTGPWGWNGSMQQLHDQVHKSLRTTMRKGISRDQHVRALIDYLRTLRLPDAADEGGRDELTSTIQRGRQRFVKLGCAECHAGQTYTTRGVYDVGLKDERGQMEFNPPSLRGLRYRRSFFHDSRAGQLDEVFTKYRHQIDRPLETAALDELLAYLRTR